MKLSQWYLFLVTHWATILHCHLTNAKNALNISDRILLSFLEQRAVYMCWKNHSGISSLCLSISMEKSVAIKSQRVIHYSTGVWCRILFLHLQEDSSTFGWWLSIHNRQIHCKKEHNEKCQSRRLCCTCACLRTLLCNAAYLWNSND